MLKLKLYIWRNFCPDYTGGLAIAIAKTEKQARKLVIASQNSNPHNWGELTVYPLDKEIAESTSGGG